MLSWRKAALIALGAVLGFAPAACGTSQSPAASGQSQADGGAGLSACPAEQAAPALLPGVRPEHRTLAYWLKRTSQIAGLDEVVLSAEDIADHNAALAARGGKPPLTHFDLLAPVAEPALIEELNERLAYIAERVASGEYIDPAGSKLTQAQAAALAPLKQLPELAPELRVTLATIELRCGPRQPGLFKGPKIDPAFDRNSCSLLRPQEALQVLARWPAAGGGQQMLLVRSRYAIGWIAEGAPLSPVVPSKYEQLVAAGDKLRFASPLELKGEGGATLAVKAGMLLPVTADGRAIFATQAGLSESQVLAPPAADAVDAGAPAADAVDAGAPAAGVVRTRRPLTRRALLEEAFTYLDTPYGWGGYKGGRDCSRFLMDLLETFDLHLPRYSSAQALAGSLVIDVPEATDDTERLALIDAAVDRGIVLLHFPGHIMLYLGRSADGVPMAMHSFAEYLGLCGGSSAAPSGSAAAAPGEVRYSVDRVQISDLSLGAGTSRRSFLRRISKIVLLTKKPSAELQGGATWRPAAPLGAPPAKQGCTDSDEVAIFVSPERPHPGEPLRVIATSRSDLGPVRLTLTDPDGNRSTPSVSTTGGPPFGYWAQVEAPLQGSWTVQLGDGARLFGCQQLKVFSRGRGRLAGSGPVWQPRLRWSHRTENLYATFVEQLLDYPADEDKTWPNLQALLAEPSKNILYNHLGQDEDKRLTLRPDCADLPYFLRLYFAWKLRLPFAFRKCNRGRQGRAPYCDRELFSNLEERAERDEVQAFAAFARSGVADGVHSGSGRTAPQDDHTDLYPVPLTREALQPGTVYADPYGHLLIIAGWIPQRPGSPGVLIGADAQPDGTVGRRRFWRGSFLFSPDTKEAGAGFKRFRPLYYQSGSVRALKNEQIAARAGMSPFSDQQYQGSTDDFYDRMEELINPRPLAPQGVLDTLLAALHEQAKRRLSSVQNAEDYKAKHTGRPIEMPRGHAIFETTGAWESYSSPSRDMRLLIAIDTVLGFPDTVMRRPERFGYAPGAKELPGVIDSLRRQLDAELRRRRFSYQRSDGSAFELSLAEVIARRQALELAYNPNDCPEIRWGAPEGSAELSTCRGRAPQDQQRLMQQYRPWFAERRRPPR